MYPWSLFLHLLLGDSQMDQESPTQAPHQQEGQVVLWWGRHTGPKKTTHHIGVCIPRFTVCFTNKPVWCRGRFSTWGIEVSTDLVGESSCWIFPDTPGQTSCGALEWSQQKMHPSGSLSSSLPVSSLLPSQTSHRKTLGPAGEPPLTYSLLSLHGHERLSCNVPWREGTHWQTSL